MKIESEPAHILRLSALILKYVFIHFHSAVTMIVLLVHEPGPQKGGHWYHKKVQIIIVIFDKVYVCTTYFCMIAVCR